MDADKDWRVGTGRTGQSGRRKERQVGIRRKFIKVARNSHTLLKQFFLLYWARINTDRPRSLLPLGRSLRTPCF